MDWKKEVVTEINEINNIFDDFCAKISHEHHKHKDATWAIGFDRWQESFCVHHDGYWCDRIYVESKDLLDVLKMFKKEIKARIDKEISEYDFENHCGKDE